MPVRFTEELLSSSKGTPPLGCRYCDRGAKMVLYITGICRQDCFYCPLSEKKKGKDVIFANEREVSGDDWLDQVVDEASRMRALGTGITGGDPMVVPERTSDAIRRLKGEFGKRHHIHLYTTGPFDPSHLREVRDAGLDEIRFHPPIDVWSFVGDRKEGSAAAAYLGLIMEAKRVGLTTGLEVPAVVDPRGEGSVYSRGLTDLVGFAVDEGLRFVNINELEASHTNIEAFKLRGYQLVPDSMAVKGSRELALSVMDRVGRARRDSRTSLHLCTSVYKDSIQLRHRLLRMARNLCKEYEVVTDDGTLLRGVVETGNPEVLLEELMDHFNVPGDLFEPGEGKLFTAPWVLQEIGRQLDEVCYISEVYPTWDGLEVERIPVSGGASSGP